MGFVRTAEIAPLRVLDDRVSILVHSAESPYRMAAMRVEVAPGGGVPPHLHEREEEAYYVLHGELEMTVGAETRRLVAGDAVHVPPRTVHGYRNAGAAPAQFLAWTVGGPIDEFFVAMSERVHRMPEDLPAMSELMARYGIGAAPGAAATSPEAHA